MTDEISLRFVVAVVVVVVVVAFVVFILLIFSAVKAECQEPRVLEATLAPINSACVDIPCALLGFPKATVTWYKDGALLNTDSPSIVKLDNGSLRICDMTPEQAAGRYHCVATNVMGTVTSSGYALSASTCPELWVSWLTRQGELGVRLYMKLLWATETP